VADHAIEVLRTSGIQEITILARRGPLQAAFTNPELLEMGELERADVEVVGGDLDALSTVALQQADKTRRRNVEILQEYAAWQKKGRAITVRFRFLATPVERLGDEDGRVRAVKIENNAIVERDDGSLAARGTGTFEEIPAQLVFRSIGYTGQPVAGIPFDERRGVIRNAGGRVTDAVGAHHVGEYVSGWIKRGPSGVIGTNKKDAQETVDAMLSDLAALTSSNGNGRPAEQSSVHLPSRPNAAAVEALLRSRQPELVTYSGWEAIDIHERALGQPAGRPRVKLTSIDELLRVAAAEEP